MVGLPEIAMPTQGIKNINLVLLELRKTNDPMGYKAVAESLNARPIIISQALSSSREAGLTKSGGIRGSYILTDIGREYALSLSYGKEKEAQNLLRKAILDNNKWQEILVFLSNQRDILFDSYDLIQFIERRKGKKWSKNMRIKIKNAYTSIMQSAGLIEQKGSKILSMYGTGSAVLLASFEVKQPEDKENTPQEKNDFARLETDDFKFEIKKDLIVIEFAKSQFLTWIEYIKQNIKQ